MNTVLITGHRGAASEAPENTRSSFDAAVAAGVDVIETDVRLSADGHVVISHDGDFSRLGGPDTPIRKMNRTEIAAIELISGPEGPETPLFMDDVLKLYPEMHFNVDLKDPGPELVGAWSKLLHKTGSADRCLTASFHDRSLRLFGRLNPHLPVSVARNGIARLLLMSLIGISRRPSAREGVLQIPEKSGVLRVISPRTLKLWHRYGWKVEAWTIDNEEDMERLIAWGVDGIITNRPSLLLDFLNRRFPGENP